MTNNGVGHPQVGVSANCPVTVRTV